MKRPTLSTFVVLIALGLSACPDSAPGTSDTPIDTGIDSTADVQDAVAEVADTGSDAASDPGQDTAGDANSDAAGDADAEVADTGPGPIEVLTTAGCENLNPLHCSLPLPSDKWLAEDPSMPTGYHLQFPPSAIPQNLAADPFDVTPFTRLDGYSPSTSIITMFSEPVDTADMAGHDSIPLSLEPEHATKLVDLETGELVAHWVENDARAESPSETLFYIRPATRLVPNRAYAVAFVGADGLDSGQPLIETTAFAALRDGFLTTSAPIEARRPRFEQLFDALEAAGVARSSLQAAWQFHTASDETIRGRMLAMRNDAVQRLGADGLGCTITSVDEDYKSTGARRVRGTFAVPWYLDAPQPPAVIVQDAQGQPQFQGTEEVDFIAIIPPTLLNGAEPGGLITFGHGLFGSAEGVLSSTSAVGVAEDAGMVLVGTDWHGMSNKDLGFLAVALANTSNFYMVGHNLQQGMVSMISLTRAMLGSCRNLPQMQSTLAAPTIDPTKAYFLGGSQGSILGTTALMLSPDIDRGVLVVGGANFSFMIERSIHFNTFELLLAPSYGSRLSTGILMVLSQSIWDDAETASYIGATATGLPGIGPKSYLYLIAENDAQVSNLSSEIAIRIAGIPVLTGSVVLPWDVPVVDAPYTGSGFIAFDVGDPLPPEGNVSPDEDFGGHGAVGYTQEAKDMIEHFLGTGEIIVPCAPDCTLSP